MSRASDRAKGRRTSGFFLLLPCEILNSQSYCSLSFKARALLVDLGAQFRGHNNGDLAATWSLMKKRGWKSKDTLHRAQQELLKSGLIELTRQGSLHFPSLYAFAWLGIDECNGKLEVRPNPVPSNIWRKVRAVA